MSTYIKSLPPTTIFAGVAVSAAILYVLFKPAPVPYVPDQQDQFLIDLKGLSNIPLSVWNAAHTPRPGEPGWEVNYNRS